MRFGQVSRKPREEEEKYVVVGKKCKRSSKNERLLEIKTQAGLLSRRGMLQRRRLLLPCGDQFEFGRLHAFVLPRVFGRGERPQHEPGEPEHHDRDKRPAPAEPDRQITDDRPRKRTA